MNTPVQQNPIDPNTPVTLTIPVGAINLILQSLAKAPYEQAAPLIDELRTQATIALAKANAAQTNAPDAAPAAPAAKKVVTKGKTK